MKFLLVIAIILATSSTSYADEWTAADSAVQAVVFTTLGADYLQTKQIIEVARTTGLHRESNPIMGHEGRRVPAEVYFLSVAALHTGLARVLPQPWRRISQIAVIALQVRNVHYNMSYGYSISF